jgi:hypothetical protein
MQSPPSVRRGVQSLRQAGGCEGGRFAISGVATLAGG